MTKAAVDILFLALIIVLGVVLFAYLIPITSKEMSVQCKRSQMSDLNRILRELDNFERMNETTLQPGSYNTIEDFTVRTSCTKEIKNESGSVKVEWKDGSDENIFTEAEWKMVDSSPLLLKEGTWDVKVSYRNVIVVPSTKLKE